MTIVKGGSRVTTLYFVRHAHSTYTADEYTRPLSRKGFADVVTVTNLLQRENIDAVVSSPYKRAIQTVEGIASSIDVKIDIVHSLRERILSTTPVEDFTSAITTVWQHESFSFEGGESNRTAQQRGVEAIVRILDCYKGQRVAIGMHGNLMVLIMQFFDSRYDFSFWQQLYMPDIYKLTFDGHTLVNVEHIQ